MNRYFQYLAGERKGEILLFDKIEYDDGLTFLSFKDGSRCNEEFVLPLNEISWEGMLMAEISDPNNGWVIKEEWVGREEERFETNKDGEKVCVQPFIPGRKVIKAIPPKKTQSKFDSPHKKNIEQEIQSSQNTDPVWVMMDKAKKFDTTIPMDIVISLPSKSLYNVAKESFDDGGSKVIDYIISNIDISKLKYSLKKALRSSYDDEEISIVSHYKPDVIEQPIIKDLDIQNNLYNEKNK